MKINTTTIHLYDGESRVSALYLKDDLLALGYVNGSVRLYFGLKNIQKKSSQDLEAYDGTFCSYLLLRDFGNEGIRTLFINDDRKLYASVGDTAICVWDLDNLEPIPSGSSCKGAHFSVYGFARDHSHGTCTNAIIFQNKLSVYLMVMKGPTVYHMDFSRVTQIPGSQSSFVDRIQPFQEQIEFAIPVNCIPCDISDKYLILLRCEERRKYSIDIVDWRISNHATLLAIHLETNFINDITPYGIILFGEYLSVVIDFDTIHLYHIKDGALVCRMKGHKFGASIISIQTFENGNNEKPGMISLGTDLQFICWIDGQATQTIRIPKHMANFSLGGPYLIKPLVTEQVNDNKSTVIVQLLFNDDTGIHVLHCK